VERQVPVKQVVGDGGEKPDLLDRIGARQERVAGASLPGREVGEGRQSEIDIDDADSDVDRPARPLADGEASCRSRASVLVER